MPTFTRITIDPQQMGGVPCIRGLRIPVATVLGKLGAGLTTQAVLAAYPDLEEADIREALMFASVALSERRIPIAA